MSGWIPCDEKFPDLCRSQTPVSPLFVSTRNYSRELDICFSHVPFRVPDIPSSYRVKRKRRNIRKKYNMERRKLLKEKGRYNPGQSETSRCISQFGRFTCNAIVVQRATRTSGLLWHPLNRAAWRKLLDFPIEWRMEALRYSCILPYRVRSVSGTPVAKRMYSPSPWGARDWRHPTISFVERPSDLSLPPSILPGFCITVNAPKKNRNGLVEEFHGSSATKLRGLFFLFFSFFLS